MKKILLPTDFSKNAQKAIEYALSLFKKEKCTFYLLHAYHDAPSSSETKVSIKNDLKALMKRTEVKNDNPEHSFEMVIETDSLMSLVNLTAIDNAVDYIFMGTKGYSTLHEVFLGSNTVDMIKYLECACPIVVVPEDAHCDSLAEIMFASDFKHRFIAPELAPLIDLSKLWDSTISVIHIQTKKELSAAQKENEELLKASLRDVKSEFREVKMENSIASTLYHLEKENTKIGMVSLLNSKNGFLKKLLREPIVKNMVFQTEVPLLVLPQIV